MEYTKPYLSFQQQADKLISRGMECDRKSLIEHLSDVGYYRLSGYWYIYRLSDDKFREGTTFDSIWGDYVFDRQFRLVVLDAIERVEVYLRTQLAYSLARETGPFGFTKKANLPRLGNDDYRKLIDKCKRKHEESREPFATHFRAKYGNRHDLPPYWVLVNMMDFGQMFTLYRGADVAIRRELACKLGISAQVLESWLRTLNTVRNICAHHGRLWNRTLGTKPMIPKKNMGWHEPIEINSAKIFSVLTLLSYLLEYVAPQTSWRRRLFSLLDTQSKEGLCRMGFTEGWKACPFWADYIEPEGNAVSLLK